MAYTNRRYSGQNFYQGAYLYTTANAFQFEAVL